MSGLGLPRGWTTILLKDICDRITKGSTPTSYGYKYQDNGIRFIKAENINGEGIASSTTSYIDDETHEFLKRSILQENDLLFSIAGTIGRVGRIRAIDLPANTNQALAIIRLKSGIVSQNYLFYYLKSDAIQKKSLQRIVGVGRANLSLTNVGEFEIPVAPLEQQKRIVAEIEKQFSRLDEAVANLKRVKANLKRYKASVLKAAVEGKLTEEWRKQHPDVEPADKLLERILVERREKWQGCRKYKEPVTPDTTGLPELPEGWGWASIEGIASNVVDCPHSTPKWTEKGKLCVRTSDFEPGRLNLTSARYVSTETFEIRNTRLIPQSGDILYSREGGILGIACEIPQGVDLCLGQRMLLIRPSEIVRSTWIMNWLNSQLVLQRVRGLTSGSASPHLNLRDIRAFPIPLPSLAEQYQIVAEVERRFSTVARVESQVDADLRRSNRLRQSILKKAFSGQLQCRGRENE